MGRNKEKRNAWRREYLKTHPLTPKQKERRIELQRQRRKLNPNREKEYYQNSGKERQKLYYENNKDIILEKMKVYAKTPKRLEWQKNLQNSTHFKTKNNLRKMKNKFGMTPSDYEVMLNSQNGCCAICGKHHTEFNVKNKTRLCIEHNHQTGKIRGLVCVKCNSVIGFANDNIQVLENAIEYLKRNA